MQSRLKVTSEVTSEVVSKLAIIGGGNMATALINGLCAAKQEIGEILVVDTQTSTLQALQQRFGTQITLRTSTQIDAQLVEVDAIILAVKPQQLSAVAQQLAPFCAQQLVLSIAAGIRASDLARWLGGYQKIVRSMPNTPAMIGRGVTGLFALPEVSASQRQIAENLLRAVGEIIWLDDESMMDAVTAVSGSGPAYVFYFIEAMQQAAIDLGLTAEQAKILSLATFQGAAQLAAESNEEIHVLRERVTSKGGTTFAALSSMEQHQVKASIMTAIQAAATRGTQLGDEFGQSA